MSDPLLIAGPDAAGKPWCWLRLWVSLDIAVGAYCGLILWVVLTFNDGWASAAAWADRSDAYLRPYGGGPPVEGPFETLVWPAFTFLVVAWLGGVVLRVAAIRRILTQISDPRVVRRLTSYRS